VGVGGFEPILAVRSLRVFCPKEDFDSDSISNRFDSLPNPTLIGDCLRFPSGLLAILSLESRSSGEASSSFEVESVFMRVLVGLFSVGGELDSSLLYSLPSGSPSLLDRASEIKFL